MSFINPVTISLATAFASHLFRDKPEFQGIDPTQFKDQLVLDNADLAGIRQNATNQALKANTANIASIKQAGAAGRLPKGATQSSIAGSSQNVAENVAKIEPKLQNAKRQSLAQFLGLKRDFDARRTAFDLGQSASDNAFNQDTIGALGRVALLQQSGFFD